MNPVPRLLVLVGLPGCGTSRVTEQLEEAGWGVVSQGRLESRKKCERVERTLLSDGRDVVADRYVLVHARALVSRRPQLPAA